MSQVKITHRTFLIYIEGSCLEVQITSPPSPPCLNSHKFNVDGSCESDLSIFTCGEIICDYRDTNSLCELNFGAKSLWLRLVNGLVIPSIIVDLGSLIVVNLVQNRQAN